MDQLETLFDVAQPAWRIEIRVKVGGGPFDPAGYSVVVEKPSGGLLGMIVHKEASQERVWAQADTLLAMAAAALSEITSEQSWAEVKAWAKDHAK